MEEHSLKEIQWEQASHGTAWAGMHRGYFSRREHAAALLDLAEQALREDPPEVLVDLGGGTGLVLGWLAEAAEALGVQRVNLDLSEAQLSAMADRSILPRWGSMADFSRADLSDPQRRFMFVSRSTLHYFGEDGLDPVLAHLYAQMQEGEYFVHQTACFAQEEDAESITTLYHMMGTDKWFPTAQEMRERLEHAGFEVLEMRPAPPLILDSDAVMERYHFGPLERAEMIRRLGGPSAQGKVGVFEVEDLSFRAYLHYHVFCCRKRTQEVDA